MYTLSNMKPEFLGQQGTSEEENISIHDELVANPFHSFIKIHLF